MWTDPVWTDPVWTDPEVYMYYKAAMSLGVVLMMLIATGAMVSGQPSMSTSHNKIRVLSIVLSLVSLCIAKTQPLKQSNCCFYAE